MLATIMAFASETAPQEAAAGGSLIASILITIHEWMQLGPVSFLVTLATGFLIVLIGKVLIICIHRILKRTLVTSKKFNTLLTNFILRLVNILGWIFLIIAFLQHMGLDLRSVLAGLGIAGIALGLAFQETLGNLLSGLMIVINSPFRIGDYIQSGSYAGTVKNMDMICVILATADNKKITMSNKLVWGRPITNYSNVGSRGLTMEVKVDRNSDIETVKCVIASLLDSYDDVLPKPVPLVEVDKISASSLDFFVQPWTKPEDYWTVFWRFQGEIGERLREAGITIPFKQLELHIVDLPKENMADK